MTRILHVSNIISPHQMPLASCFAAAVGEDNFRYAATQAPMTDRQEMGWKCEKDRPWILRAGENEDDKREFLKWWEEADVVLCGERLIELMGRRIRSGRLTFYMSERWWKPPIGIARMLHPRFARMATRFRQFAASSRFHYLPIGPYAATDMRRLTSLPNRTWLWGYFTALPDPLPCAAGRKGSLSILYAGRMLSCKRVDTLVRAFHVLWLANPTVRLTLIGDGPCRASLEKLVCRLGLGDDVALRRSVPMEAVWQQMRGADIYVLPSNGYEGWGAVINEAMSLGCAVVASEAGGAAKSTICDGVNGFLFRPGDWRQLGQILIRLSENEPLRLQLAKAGQRTITDCWSPAVAAERFLAVADALLSSRTTPDYVIGPMSRA